MRLIWMLLLLFSSQLFAIDSNPQDIADPQQAARYQQLIKELRCMVCPNQPLSDSDAGLAQDLREEVRDMVVSGQSSQDIKQFLVARYGEKVLYRPDLEPKTYLLWLGPAVLLLIGFAVVLLIMRRPKPVEPISAEQQAKLEQIIKQQQD